MSSRSDTEMDVQRCKARRLSSRAAKFELVINLKSAKQIGLTIPHKVLGRADRVIKALMTGSIADLISCKDG